MFGKVLGTGNIKMNKEGLALGQGSQQEIKMLNSAHSNNGMLGLLLLWTLIW